MWPFKKRRLEQREKPHVKTDDQWLRIEALDFFGQYSSSPDGSYTIAWADRDPSGRRGGFRESGHGTYVLVCNGELVLTGKMERPNDGRVANNGSFVLNDWLFGEGLKGIFYGIDKNGTVLVKHRFEANLFNNGISPDGRFAVCQTCNSDTSDSGLLWCFDLTSGALLWKVQPPTGWAEDYSFDPARHTLYLHYSKLGVFRYSLESGLFEDREGWVEQKIKHGNGFELLAIAQDRMKLLSDVSSKDEVDELIDLLQAALTRGLSTYPNQQAIVYRYIGELKERLGDWVSAIEFYEEALKHNPKVGVKRRLSQLKANRQR
jgi:hypothetical protein